LPRVNAQAMVRTKVATHGSDIRIAEFSSVSGKVGTLVSGDAVGAVQTRGCSHVPNFAPPLSIGTVCLHSRDDT
jgi:hypothetical protein